MWSGVGVMAHPRAKRCTSRGSSGGYRSRRGGVAPLIMGRPLWDTYPTSVIELRIAEVVQRWRWRRSRICSLLQAISCLHVSYRLEGVNSSCKHLAELAGRNVADPMD